MRPSFDTIYMGLAHRFAERATCQRLQVGCVIVSDDYEQVYGLGYNGNARGRHNGCERETPGNCGCLHAEDNAVTKCHAPKSMSKLVYCTHLPCEMCAKRLINLGGVLMVYYAVEYRSDVGRLVLVDAGIEVVCLGE